MQCGQVTAKSGKGKKKDGTISNIFGKKDVTLSKIQKQAPSKCYAGCQFKRQQDKSHHLLLK